MKHLVDFPEWFGKTVYSPRKLRNFQSLKGTPPWGYEPNYEKKHFDPISKQLDMLRWAFLLLHTGATYESVAEWLTKISDKKVSAASLRILVSNERTRRRKAKNLRNRIAQGKTEGVSPQERNTLEDDTNYPTEDREAYEDFGVCARDDFRRARRHNSLVSRRIALESKTRSSENKLYLSWLKRTERVRRNRNRSNFFRANGVKLNQLANDNYLAN